MSDEPETVPKSRVGSKYYIVAAGVPTLALTLLYGNNYPGAKIINQEYEKGRTDQQWLVSSGPNGGKLYKNVAGDLYLGSNDGILSQSLVTGQRADFAIEFVEKDADQGVSLYPYGSSDVYLDNQYQGITEPVPVWLYRKNDTIAQVWQFKSAN